MRNISRSSYHKWVNHKNSENDILNKQIASKIEQMHVEHPDMGYRRLRDALAHYRKTAVHNMNGSNKILFFKLST